MSKVYHLPDYHYYPGFGMFRSDKPDAPTPPHKGVEVIDTADTPQSYRVKGICMNCKWEGQVRIPLGLGVTRAPGYTCPACRCGTVEGTSLVARDHEEGDSSIAMAAAESTYRAQYAKYEVKLAEWESNRKSDDG